MTDDFQAVVSRDDSFFAALLMADTAALRTILTDDFVIVDVMAGQVTARQELLQAIESGQLRFLDITTFDDERVVRLQDTAAVVIGRTRMTMSYLGQEATASSRYSHVYADTAQGWRLWSAQGTQLHGE